MILRSACALSLLAAIGCGGMESDLGGPSAATVDRVAVMQTDSALSESEIATTTDTAVLSSPVPPGRKIIFEARLHIDVEDFGKAAATIDRTVMDHGGFITASQRGGRSGSTRSGQWTLRVPVEQYRPLIEAVTQIGELRDHQETSQEVTDEYYDLQARIKNKQQEEERLLTHLNETARNLNEILTIEKEISRVRGEIERMQGRLRLLADQTSLSTVHLTLEEIETFLPAETPTFATRITRSWSGSLESVSRLLQSVAITLVAIAPWLPVIVAAGFFPALWLRRRLSDHRLS